MSIRRRDKLYYIGDGGFIPGVPARNLTVDESEKHAAAIEANQQATGVALYRVSRSIEAPAEDAGKEATHA